MRRIRDNSMSVDTCGAGFGCSGSRPTGRGDPTKPAFSLRRRKPGRFPCRACRPRTLPQAPAADAVPQNEARSEEHTSELQSLMRISYAVFCLKKKNKTNRILKN